MIRHECVVLDFLSVNCYLVWDDQTKQGLIFDPGSSEKRIYAAVERVGCAPQAVILTHAHVDHIGRVPEVCAKYGIPVWLHEAEFPVYRSDQNCLLPWAGAVQGLPEPLKGDCPTAGMTMQVLHTPGHTPGGCCFYFPGEKFVLTGDTLFRGTYGRCDFPGGSETAILSSIRTRLLTLPAETEVLPGHEEKTTIRNEMWLAR